MANFKKTNVQVYAKSSVEQTADSIYWKKYSPPVLLKEFGPIDYIDFLPTEPHLIAVTCSVTVQLYNPITKLATKNLSGFHEAAYGGSFRQDGQLLCAGGQEPIVRVYDVNKRRLLRRFIGHKAPVHRTYFTSDCLHVASFSDDKTTAIWDIPTEKQLITFDGLHTDYIRAGAVSPVSPNIVLSGSYDKTVKMYDIRQERAVFTVNHDAPVESLLFLPSGGIFLSAGGTEVRVWDALAGGKLVAKIAQHHKTITCLKVASNGQRIMSGSLDRHVKIYDAGTYKTVHTLDYPNAVLSIGISADDETIAAGMVDGVISVRRREDEAPVTSSKKKMSYRYLAKSQHTARFDVVVEEQGKETMSKSDVCLRKFQYSKALDQVMVSYVVNKTPHVTVALLQELIRRQGLKQALAGRDGKSLVNILKFLIKYVGSVRFGRVISHVAGVLLDVYEDNMDDLGAEPKVMFNLLSKKLEEEEDLLRSLLELQGSLQMLLNVSECPPAPLKQKHDKLEPSKLAQPHLFSIA